jgi:hypothetical protein
MMKTFAAVLILVASSGASAAQPRWSAEQANRWYDQQPWLVGCNFIPSTTINQLEMWQQDTFDPATIDRELGFAQNIGMNTARVFLHNIPWEQDASGFKRRIETYLTIAGKHQPGMIRRISFYKGK